MAALDDVRRLAPRRLDGPAAGFVAILTGGMVLIVAESLIVPSLFEAGPHRVAGLALALLSATLVVVKGTITRRTVHFHSAAIVLAGYLFLSSYADPALVTAGAAWFLLVALLTSFTAGRVAAMWWSAVSTLTAAVLVAQIPGPTGLVVFRTATVAALVALAAVIYQLLRHRLDTALMRAQELATHDELTGLLNRRGMKESLPVMFGRHVELGCLAVLVCDLDHFKHVNDRWGHAGGDEVLRLVGQVIRRTVRAGDLTVRLGGEELAVLAAVAHPEEAMIVAERLRVGVQRACRPWSATMSIGVAVSEPGADPVVCFDSLLRDGDDRLYRAKQAGRNRVVGPPPLPSPVR